MIDRVHHIDFVVRDLDAAGERWQKLLGRPPIARERLAHRGVELLRFCVGGIWIILVQPTREDSPVQAFLDRHGEGFFHIAWAVDDLDAEATRLRDARLGGVGIEPRRGVEGWRLLDIDGEAMFGAMSQLVEESDA